MSGYSKILQETEQDLQTRIALYKRLTSLLDGRAIFSFFTSFRFPVMIEDKDVDMLEELLSCSDCKKGIALIINSPGGDALAAERLIRVGRKYSGENFVAVVPRMAKSAATMVCLGADKILMGQTSEIGPIDPQVPIGARNM